MDDGADVQVFRARELVVDTSADTLETARTILQLAEHRGIVVYQKDAVCFQDALP